MTPRSPLRVLLLVNDEMLRDLVLDALQKHVVTVVNKPHEVPEQLCVRQFALAIVTNFGLSPWDAIAAVPVARDCPVLFLTGHLDANIEAMCALKHIPIRQVPIDLAGLRRELQIALDEVF